MGALGGSTDGARCAGDSTGRCGTGDLRDP
nr:MAG TPA: hypothetical protein [Caudoviricetes sp.]